MKSSEKVRAALDQAETFADDETVPSQVRAAATMLSMGRGPLEGLLPGDDAELDELLEKGASWMWSLRSDDAS